MHDGANGLLRSSVASVDRRHDLASSRFAYSVHSSVSGPTIRFSFVLPAAGKRKLQAVDDFLFKKIAVCARALQPEIFICLGVNQHPVRFNVAVPAILPFARKRMVSVAGIEGIVVR